MKTKLAHLEGNGHVAAPAAKPTQPETQNGHNHQSEISAPLCDLRASAVNSSPSSQSAIGNRQPKIPSVVNSPSQLSTPPSAKASAAADQPSPSARTGKIARLPVEAREEVNQMLRTGYRHAAIVKKLAELGHPDISINSIYTWKYGGFVDWLREKQKFESPLALPKVLEQCTKAGRIAEIQQVALLFASTALGEIMQGFDFNRARDVLYRQPQLLPSFVHSIAALTRCASDLATSLTRIQDAETSVRKKLGIPNYAQPEASSTAVSEAPLPLEKPESAIASQQSPIGNPPSTIDDRTSEIGNSPSAIGDRLSAISPDQPLTSTE